MPEDRGSAVAASNRTNTRHCRPDRALDHVHLARQCQDDLELAKELLGLFRIQSHEALAHLAGSAPSALDSTANVAHKLRGSALAVGAGRVSLAASAIEEKALVARGQARPDAGQLEALSLAIAALEAEVLEATVEIDRFCS